MHSILLIIDKPENASNVGQQAWSNLQAAIDNNLNNVVQGQVNHIPKKLAENVLLIPVHDYFSIFVTLTALSQSSGYAYQVLFFEKEPE